jgi:hypothetical protein
MHPLLLFALVYFALVLILAQRRAPEEYSPTRHTISQLASQGYPRRRLMQAGFVIYGLLFTAALLQVMRVSQAPLYRDVPHLVYGLALLPTGFYCAVPFRRGLRFSRKEARRHAFWAQLAAGAFGVGIAVHAVLYPGPWGRVFHAGSVLLYAAIAVWFVRSAGQKGRAQRLLYGYGSVWLLVTYGTGVFLSG